MSDTNDLRNRIEKLERIIYGSGVTNGLIYNIASIQQQLKATTEQLNELHNQISTLNNILNGEIKEMNKRIEEYDKRISQLDSMMLKLISISAGISSAISLTIGIIISALLHI